MECNRVLITPGLVNAHEHTSYSFAGAQTNLAPIYVHRDEWRMGQNGKPKLGSTSTNEHAVLAMVEIRHLLHGETVVAGNGGIPGFVKNIASPASATNIYVADMQTFPLGTDVNARFGSAPCSLNADELGTPKFSPNAPLNTPYVAHVGEGVNCAAKLELDDTLHFISSHPGRTYSLVHAIMLDESHVSLLKSNDVSVIWSPRSNVALYGKTLDPTWLLDAGATVGLGTDWSLSGSYDMIEEMSCAKTMNRISGARMLTGAEILGMATRGSAKALGIGDRVGVIAPGYEADIAIFDDPSLSGLDTIGFQKNDAVVAVFVDGELKAGDVARFVGDIPSICGNVLEGKFICHDFSSMQFSFAQMLAVNQGKIPPIGTFGQAACARP